MHLHTFRPAPEGTLMEDRVDYRLPMGLAGRLVHIWKVEGQLKNIFAYRAARINERAIKRELTNGR